MSIEKILFVDDEEKLLEGVQRALFDEEQFEVNTALGAVEAIMKIEKEGPFAVIISDMRMPGIDGIQFLQNVQTRAPHSVRVMLTGNIDLDTAMAAINKGNVFRYITKPVEDETLKSVLSAAIDQYHLIRAEQELLEGTVKGSIEVLTSLLSLSNPVAFSRANRIKTLALEIAEHLKFEDRWLIEVTTLLSQIGCVTIPHETLKKVSMDEPLSEKEQKMIKTLPSIGHDLLEKIPRLKPTAEIIGGLETSFTELQGKTYSEGDKEQLLLATSAIRLASRLEVLKSRGFTKEKILGSFQDKERYYHPEVLKIIPNLELKESEKQVISIKINELKEGMILEEEVRADEDNLLLTAKGQAVTTTMKKLMENYYYQGRIEERVMVSVPNK